VAYNSLPYCLVVLGVFTLEGICHQILVDKDLRMEGVLLLELLNIDIIMLRGLDPGRRHRCGWVLQ
jgi:hypothetical protein